jgi:hypothetical protein
MLPKKEVAEKITTQILHSINFPYFVPFMTGHRGQYNTARKDAIYMPDKYSKNTHTHTHTHTHTD